MTCEGCIHHSICRYENQQIPLCDLLYCETDHVEKSGCPFTEKADVQEETHGSLTSVQRTLLENQIRRGIISCTADELEEWYEECSQMLNMLSEISFLSPTEREDLTYEQTKIYNEVNDRLTQKYLAKGVSI